MSRVATCTVDGDPLVATFAFSGAEFICMKCGRLYGWLEPSPADETPELVALMEQRRSEWLELGAGAILTPGMRRTDCEQCDAGEPHSTHATPEERAASDAALERVRALRADAPPAGSS